MIRVAVGIDPGYRAFGFAVLVRDAEQRWNAAHVHTERTTVAAYLHDRMHAIFRAMDPIPKSLFVDQSPLECIIACEDQTGVHEGKRARGQTSTEAMLVQQVVGMARVVAFDYGVRFIEVTPAQAKAVLLGIKQTASKAQVQRAVRAMVKGCPKVMSEHASDACATALAGARLVPVTESTDYGRLIPPELFAASGGSRR